LLLSSATHEQCLVRNGCIFFLCYTQLIRLFSANFGAPGSCPILACSGSFWRQHLCKLAVQIKTPLPIIMFEAKHHV